MIVTPDELRKGNWVLNPSTGKMHQLSIIDINDIDMKYKEREPIPLSEDILIKCGFVTDEHKIEYSIGLPLGNGSDLFIEDEGHPSKSWGIKSFPVNFNYLKDIKYLHQLQNLYYSLTGTELIYKP